MEILGIGTGELIAILIIMLIVAGPQRMIRWAYVLGQYVAKFRKIWAEIMDGVQKEFDQAGVGITLPKDLPTRGGLNSMVAGHMNKTMNQVMRPMQEVVDEARINIPVTPLDELAHMPVPINNGEPAPESQP